MKQGRKQCHAFILQAGPEALTTPCPTLQILHSSEPAGHSVEITFGHSTRGSHLGGRDGQVLFSPQLPWLAEDARVLSSDAWCRSPPPWCVLSAFITVGLLQKHHKFPGGEIPLNRTA